MGMIQTGAKDDVLEGDFKPEDAKVETRIAPVAEPAQGVEVWTPKFSLPMEAMVERRNQTLEYMAKVLKKDVHYGVIPGTGSKPALLKPGAQALCRDMNLHPEPVIVEHVADVIGKDHGGEVFLSYNIRVDMYGLNGAGARIWVGSGFGSCNSWEERYRWRTSSRVCPSCGKDAIIKGNPKYAPRDKSRLVGVGTPEGGHYAIQAGYEKGGWTCWKKKDGCGASFTDNEPKLTSQQAGKIPNDRVMDLDNTIFKQASKRALVEAVLNVTGASDVFTQDVEEKLERDDRYDGEPDTSGAPLAPTLTPMTEPHAEALRVRARHFQQSKDEKERAWWMSTWKQFMAEKCGGKWEGLFANDALYPEAAKLLGVIETPAKDASKAAPPASAAAPVGATAQPAAQAPAAAAPDPSASPTGTESPYSVGTWAREKLLETLKAAKPEDVAKVEKFLNDLKYKPRNTRGNFTFNDFFKRGKDTEAMALLEAMGVSTGAPAPVDDGPDPDPDALPF